MAKDPYKYFRVEARELIEGLGAGILRLEKGDAPAETIALLLRLGHTLKGAARVVRQPGIAELAHTIEGLLGAHRDAGGPLSPRQSAELLRIVDEIAALVDGLDAGGERPAGAVSGPADERLETLRVDLRDMDALLRGVTEVGVHLGVLRDGAGAADRMHALLARLTAAGHLQAGAGADELRATLDTFRRRIVVDVERIAGELDEVREVAHRLRLIPAQTIFASLERAVHDAAQSVGRRVELETSGGEVRLDAHVLALVRDALLHVVRNAVAHGIEPDAERRAAGKPSAGRVLLVVERSGSRVAFSCADDGRGVDLDAVRRTAVERGLVSGAEAAAMAAPDLLRFLTTGGLSTARSVSELAGRGIGLDVVRETAARLKGELRIATDPGRGTTLSLDVPVSIASLRGLIVEAGGTKMAIPLEAVRHTLRVGPSDLARTADRETIVHEGKVIPFLPLARAIRPSAAAETRRGPAPAVVVQAGARTVAVGVDRLIGASNVVVRSLPRVVEAARVVAGASLDAEGNPQLVLDPEGLVAAVEGGRVVVAEAARPARAPILVIDDSLTTRMLEQSILESAGYEVETATSAEEALAKAAERRYALFIVDVEMPGMDGFEFVARTRRDPVLREIPAILVTSRNAVEDRRRGEQAGARAYIVKSEFDQDRLLKTIRTLMG